MGTPVPEILDRALLPGRSPCSAMYSAVREPDRIKPLHAPPAEIIIPTDTILPPMLPKICIATADAGDSRFIITSAGSTHR